MWDIIPDSYKSLPNFSVFKNRIKKMETRELSLHTS